MAKEDKAGEPTVKQLQADLAKLTKAHDVIVKQNIKDKESAKEVIDGLTNKLAAEKEQAKKQREETATKTVGKMRALVDAAPHKWVQVFHKGLKDNVDFSFNYEGLQYKLYSGVKTRLSEIIINHLKLCRYPQTKLSQGEAGGTPKIQKGFHYNFHVVNCEKPVGDFDPAAVEEPETALV